MREFFVKWVDRDAIQAGLICWVVAMILAFCIIALPSCQSQFERKLGCSMYTPDAAADIDSVLRNRTLMPKGTDINKAVALDVLLGMSPGVEKDLKTRFDNQPQAATIMGAVLDVVLGGEETSNCNSISTDKQTVYLYIVPKVTGATKKDALRIAITPRMRLLKTKSKVDWSFAELLKLKGKDILATGWLYFDKWQWDYARDNNIQGPRNIWIKTCWSLHPVTDLKEFAP